MPKEGGVSIIFINQSNYQISLEVFNQALEVLLQQIRMIDSLKLEVVLVTKRRIQQLNNRYRQINQPTDILSFQSSASAEGVLGSLVIAPAYVFESLKEFKGLIEEELKFLAVHGTLHLLGYHHR